MSGTLHEPPQHSPVLLLFILCPVYLKNCFGIGIRLNYTASMPISNALENPQYSDYSNTIQINSLIISFQPVNFSSVAQSC